MADFDFVLTIERRNCAQFGPVDPRLVERYPELEFLFNHITDLREMKGDSLVEVLALQDHIEDLETEVANLKEELESVK